MHVERITVGPFEVNCYIVWEEGCQKCLVIDPGDDADQILNELDRNGLSPEAIILTHAHADHAGALHDLLVKYPVPVVIHPDDASWLCSESNQIQPYYAPPKCPEGTDFHTVHDAQTLDYLGKHIQVLHTPGHSPGGICLHIPEEQILFTGDTLFAGSCGRTDLPGGSSRTLAQSLARLADLPPETRIYPGHGPDSTIAHERQTNFFLVA